MTAVVGVTAQSTRGVTRRRAVDTSVVLAQIDAVMNDIGVDAIKIGTAWSRRVVIAIAGALESVRVPVVLDPVLVTAASSLIANPVTVAGAVIERFFPLAVVITPNLREAQMLTGMTGVRNGQLLAERLVELGARAVVVTSGGPKGRDDCFFDGTRHAFIEGPWHDTGAVHGSGCAHSAALAAFLSYGLPLFDAVCEARAVAAAAVRHGWAAGGGPGPVDVLDLGDRSVN